jgi:hypothetical protein
MLESRWGRRLGPGIAAVAGILVIATASVGTATAGERPPPDCAAATAAPRATGSAWFRLDPTLVDGRRTGQRLTAGQGRGRAWSLALDAESFAASPRDGLVVVGSDDGARSTLSVVDLGRGCRVWVGSVTDVVRSAVLAADGRTIFEHRVARADRRDLGIWRHAPGADAVRVLPPPDVDAAFGRTWLTELRWNGRRLIVASCGETACRFRELDPMSGAVRSVSDPSLGSLVGASGDALVVRGACRGLPCPVLRADLATGRLTALGDAVGTAVVAAAADGTPIVAMAALDGHDLTTVTLDGAPVAGLVADPAVPLLPSSPEVAVELPAGWIPVAGPSGPLARRVDAAVSRPLDEVRP